MIRVKNQKVITRLSQKSLAANRLRNVVAICAIALTTMLFTALFTMAGSLMKTFEQQTFRQVGGDMHGTFKNLNQEELEALQDDPLIAKPAKRLMLGFLTGSGFNKIHAEISYMDAACANGYFCTPQQGTLPAEGTDQIACDTRILEALGVKPEIGAKITLPYTLGDGTAHPVEKAGTFTLSGWWEYDTASVASHALVPLSYAEETLAGYDNHDDPLDSTGAWALNVYLKDTGSIRTTLEKILANHGYQCTDNGLDNYIDIGVNWAYLGAQASASADPGTFVLLAVLLLVIILTGYLVIYNVFLISVSGDIRFYGLLKTIGTTPRQLRRIVRRQALLLSCAGIPVGLVAGYFLGVVLAPYLLAGTSVSHVESSANPLIFVGAALFALGTVLFSCRKPGQIAAKVSPIEALRYTGNDDAPKTKKATRRTAGGGKPFGMALANLGRNRKKTVLVAISLAMAVALLQVTYTLAISFDMDKYLINWVSADYVFSDAGFFQSHSDGSLAESDLHALQDAGFVERGGRIYQNRSAVSGVTAGWYKGFFEDIYAPDSLDYLEKDTTTTATEPLYYYNTDVFAMEDLPLEGVEVLEGSLDALKDPSQRAVAIIEQTDDYGVPMPSSIGHDAKIGDTISVRYVTEYELYNTETGEVMTSAQADANPDLANLRPVSYDTAEYTVAALVTAKASMMPQGYSGPKMLINPEVLRQDTDDITLLDYLFDVTPGSEDAAESFLKNYTTTTAPNLDYSSKAAYVSQFEGLRQTFLAIGGALSTVVAIVGVLNFFNAILTSLFARRREFAVLQAVGMTGRQLKTMLAYEGVLYALLAGALGLVLSIGVSIVIPQAVSQMLWFLTCRFTLVPVLVMFPLFVVLGVALPLLCYRFTARQSIVERLHQSE